MHLSAKEDEEWKEFEQKEVDYSGLRLQALQIRWGGKYMYLDVKWLHVHMKRCMSALVPSSGGQ